MPKSHTPSSSGRRRRAVAVAICLTLSVPVLPASAGDPFTVRSPEPAPNAVIQAGPTLITADVGGSQAARVSVDGQVVDDLHPDGVPVVLAAGPHQIAILDQESVAREWTVHAAGISITQAPEDLLALARVASGGRDFAHRPVLLVNPATLALSAAAAPLAVATGALLMPVDGLSVPAEVMDYISQARESGEEVLLLGGLDAISRDVEDQLDQAGYQPRRIGTGSASDVAAAAARFAPVAQVYTRGGVAVPREVLVAADEPVADLLQSAALAAGRGASLVLADGATISDATAEIIAERPTVVLGANLDPQAAAAATAAADPDARVTTAPALPEPAREVWVGDAATNPAAALLATRAAGPDVAVLVDRGSAREWIGANVPAEATVATSQISSDEVAGWWVDGPAAPVVQVSVPEHEGMQIVLDVDRVPEAAFLYVAVHGVEWPGTLQIQGTQAVWTGGPRPVLPPELEPAESIEAPLQITGVVVAEGHLRHVAAMASALISPASSLSPEGFVVAGGVSPVVGSGPLRTFTIEIEPQTGLDLAAVRAQAEQILLDPTRGWTARGERSLQRVDSPGAASIRVVIARPGTVDAYCARAGLGTGGALSCWDGRRAMLNLTRWNTGVSPFHTDLTVYRSYLVSHEVGHGLGYHHVGCPAAGALAPVMQQQSKGLGSCVANGWPYPNG
ncbi:MAG: DUF3152 domain-containing protein [Euzebya sp.]